jgi:colicin import membrane protein
MLENMTMSLDTTHESSVVFNLRQLMQLEADRVAREEEAAQAECERIAQAEHEAAARQQRLLAEAAERAQDVREAARLRVRLEAQAAECAQDERLRRQHADALQRVQVQAQRARVRLTRSCIGAGLLLCSLVVVNWRDAAQRVVDAETRARSSLVAASERARELAELRARLEHGPVARNPVGTSVVAPPTATARPPHVVAARPPRALRPVRKPSRSAETLPFVESDDDDPIAGI